MAQKYTTKRKAAQHKVRRVRRQHVNYFAAPKPLWKQIKRLLPKPVRQRGRGRPALSNRLVLNAIWCGLWTGCQWKALPQAQFGVSSSTAYARFQLWREQDETKVDYMIVAIAMANGCEAIYSNDNGLHRFAAEHILVIGIEEVMLPPAQGSFFPEPARSESLL